MSIERPGKSPLRINTRRALAASLAAILSAGAIGSAQAGTGMEAYLKALRDEADGETIVLAEANIHPVREDTRDGWAVTGTVEMPSSSLHNGFALDSGDSSREAPKDMDAWVKSMFEQK